MAGTSGPLIRNLAVCIILHVGLLHFYLFTMYENYAIVAPQFRDFIMPKLLPRNKQHMFPGLMLKTLFLTQWNAVSNYAFNFKQKADAR